MAKYQGPVIDSDVHHTWSSDDDIIAYLPKKWRDYVKGSGRAPMRIDPPFMTYPHVNGPNKRLDTFPPNGGPPGSDYETLCKQLLDPFRIERAVLSFDPGGNGALDNLYFATEVVRAANDWNIEHWLSIPDDRLRSVVMVPTQMPEEAAKEIRRVGKHPRIVEVLLMSNGLRRPFGHPLYHPIYEAASEMGLPVAIHVGGQLCEGGNQNAVAGGAANSRLEFHTLANQSSIHYLASFIEHGVFEKFPDLKLLLVEDGISWVPWLIWGLDANYKILRSESPWVKRLPSEYFREHVRFTTQPLEDTPDPQQLIEVLEAFEGMDDLLCFATDYPHWDADDPMYVSRKLPEPWLEKIFHKNASELYGWPIVSAGAAPAGVAE
jgi:predicted TIM-barrel fold metal-dependent hydrolase